MALHSLSEELPRLLIVLIYLFTAQIAYESWNVMSYSRTHTSSSSQAQLHTPSAATSLAEEDTSWSSPTTYQTLEDAFGDTVNLTHGHDTFEVTSIQGATSQRSAIKAIYPRGSTSPIRGLQLSGISGGVSFFASPIDLTSATHVAFEYSVYFPPDFDFVRGGKLPGLYGKMINTDAPSGGASSEKGFSLRLMWRRKGEGEVYLYAPRSQSSSILSIPPHSEANGIWGLSLGRGSFVFRRGQWTTVRLHIGLNTPGKYDGLLKLAVDSKTVIDFKEANYRNTDAFGHEGIMFETFFGGHLPKWAPHTDQHLIFSDFKLDVLD